MQDIYTSHAAIPAFRLLRPRSAEDAARSKADLGGAAHYFAGGVDLVPALRGGRAVSALIALNDIASFHGVERNSETVKIGAGLTYAGLAKSSAIQNEIPDFADAIATVANVRIRHVATLGGNIMSCNTCYDLLPSLLALGVRLVFTNRHGSEAHVDGTDSQLPDGLLTRIEIPARKERRFVLDRSYKPVISLAVCVEQNGGRISGRAALGCAHFWPLVLPLELGSARTLSSLGACAADAASEFAAQLAEPLTDMHGSAAYRRTLAEVLLRRALTRLARG